MAKIKAAKPGKKKRSGLQGAFPCLLLILTAILLISFLFYAILKGS